MELYPPFEESRLMGCRLSALTPTCTGLRLGLYLHHCWPDPLEHCSYIGRDR